MRRRGPLDGLWFPIRDRLIELHERGLEVRETADALKISPSMVRGALKAIELQKVLNAARSAAMEQTR